MAGAGPSWWKIVGENVCVILGWLVSFDIFSLGLVGVFWAFFFSFFFSSVQLGV